MRKFIRSETEPLTWELTYYFYDLDRAPAEPAYFEINEALSISKKIIDNFNLGNAVHIVDIDPARCTYTCQYSSPDYLKIIRGIKLVFADEADEAEFILSQSDDLSRFIFKENMIII